MSPQISAARANRNLVILLFIVTVAIFALSTLHSKCFYHTNHVPVFLTLHTLLEFASIICSFLVCGAAWHSWMQGKGLRDILISATFLVVGLFDLSHTLSYYGMPDFITPNSPDKAAVFWLFARFSAAVGLLAAALVPGRKQYTGTKNKLIAWTVIVTLFTIGFILWKPAVFPQLYVWEEGSTLLKIWLEYLLMGLNVLAIFVYGYRNPSQRHTYYLRIALVFCLASELSITLYANVFDNLIGHLYKLAGYYYIMRALFETAILRPYVRLSRLAGILRHLSERNMTLYRKAQDNQVLLKNVFIQMGSAIAAKHDIQAVFSQIVQAAAAVFNCAHVFLGVRENGTGSLKVVATVSSFLPLENIPLEESFMGKVFSENAAQVIKKLADYPELICPAIQRAGLRSMAGVPIVVQDETIGVLELFSEKEAAYSQSDVLLLTAFAQRAGEAIHHAKLYENTVESYQQLSMQYEVVKNIALQTSPGALLKMVTERLYNLLKADGAVSFIMHHRGDGLHTEPVFVHNFSQAEVNHLQRLFSKDNSAWPWVNSADDNTNGAQEEKVVTISILMRKRLEILPLQTGGTLQGLIAFAWKDADTRMPSNLSITLKTIAAQTAIALERAYLYENVKEMALTDALTKLANRRQFDLSLTREMSRTRNFGRSMCLIMLDIDFFKKVNDNFGHLAGDEILRQLGDLIKKHFRNTDFAARFGGEEFAVILPETGIEDAVALAESFRQKVEQTEFDTGFSCNRITISAGVSMYDQNSGFNSANDFIDAADNALYTAKQSGRNRVVKWQ